MYEIEKIFHFEAGHVLTHHDGKCRVPHGHSYALTVKLRFETLVSSGPKTNMGIDFQEISDIVKPMIEEFLDHRWLNDTLGTDSPTAELIAKWIYDYLAPKLPNLHAISLNETASSRVTYCVD